MFIQTLTAIAFSTFLFVIIQVGTGSPAGQMISRFIGQIPFGDKILHFILLAVLSFLLNGVLHRRRLNLCGADLLSGSLLVAFGITLEECSQLFIPSRNFEFMDMLCNYAGIYAGSFLICPQKKQHSTDGDQNSRETFSFQTIFNRTRPLCDESRHGRRPVGRMGGSERG